MKCFDPKPNVDNPWAKSILEAALPLQEVMDRIYNTICVRVTAAGRDICITSSALEKGLRDALQSEDAVAKYESQAEETLSPSFTVKGLLVRAQW